MPQRRCDIDISLVIMATRTNIDAPNYLSRHVVYLVPRTALPLSRDLPYTSQASNQQPLTFCNSVSMLLTQLSAKLRPAISHHDSSPTIIPHTENGVLRHYRHVTRSWRRIPLMLISPSSWRRTLGKERDSSAPPSTQLFTPSLARWMLACWSGATPASALPRKPFRQHCGHTRGRLTNSRIPPCTGSWPRAHMPLGSPCLEAWWHSLQHIFLRRLRPRHWPIKAPPFCSCSHCDVQHFEGSLCGPKEIRQYRHPKCVCHRRR